MRVKMDETAKRRVRTHQLLFNSKAPAGVGKVIWWPRQIAYRRHRLRWERKIESLREMSKGGRPPLLSEQIAELRETSVAGPMASGYGKSLGTFRPVCFLIQKRHDVECVGKFVWRTFGPKGISSQ